MPDLRRLFGTDEKFLANAQGVLELRLAHCLALHPDLRHHVSQIIKNLDHPSTAMEMMRGVFHRAAAQMLKADCPTATIPSAWVENWKQNGRLDEKGNEQRDREILGCRVPATRASRKWLLNLLVDTRLDGHSKLRPSTFRLMEFVYDAGTYGAHACEIGEEVPLFFGISACFAAVELSHHVAEDLRRS
jgi:hypothetical protein